MNLAYVINKYLSDPILDELRPSTRYNRKHGLKIVQDKIGHVPVEQIRKSTINKFLAEFISEKGKQANLKSVLKTLESWALDMDMIPYSFMTGVKIAKSKDGHKPWTDKEVEAAIKHARPDIARAITLAVQTGQRA